MYQTNYHRPSSVAEAAKMLGEAEDGKFVAGGQTLIPTMKQRLAAPSDLIDLRHIAEIRGISVSGENVKIGAGTTHAEVAADAALANVCPAICHLAAHIGDPHVRHMGTLGGSIANNDPAADYPAALLALGAIVHTDRREVSADHFFAGLFETALEDDEIVTAVSFTVPEKAGYAKFPNPASRYALTGVFVAKRPEGVRVTVTGAGENGVFRASALEDRLARSFEPAALEGKTVPADGLMSDIHATTEYRAHLIVVMAKRAVQAANG